MNSCNSSTTTTVTLPSPPTHQHFNYSSMTRDQQKYCGAIVRNLKRHRDAAPFKNPVNHVEVPDYPLIIKHPMDLNHVETKLNNSDYPTVEEFIADVRLIFNNCFKYNGPEAIISVLCQNVESAFEKSLRQMPSSQAVKQEQQRQMSISKEPSPPLSQHNLSSPPPVLDDYLSGGRPKREIHCPSKDYPETFTTPIKKPSQNTSLQMKYCWQVLREFKKTKYRNQIYPFLTPVDPIELNLPDYTTIIKNPMDLSSIEHKLLNDQYKEPEQFEQDVVLVFNNCYTYNPPTSPIYQMAQEMSRVFQDKWAQRPLIADVVKKEEEGSGSVGLKKSSAGNSRRQSSTKSSTKRKSVSKSESDDVDLDEEDQEDPDDQIAQLERSIKNISKQIESMQQNTQKRKSATPPSIKQEVEPKPKKKLGRPVGRTDSVKRKRMGKKPVLDDSDDDEGVKDYPFSHDEKMALSREINTLDDERLLAVSSIIQRSMPQLQKVRGGQVYVFEYEIRGLITCNYRTVKMRKLNWILMHWMFTHSMKFTPLFTLIQEYLKPKRIIARDLRNQELIILKSNLRK
jgi:bromodomain-containing factor 1